VEQEISLGMEELTEGDPEVLLQVGTYTVQCRKNGRFYREWVKEAQRRAQGGAVPDDQPYEYYIEAPLEIFRAPPAAEERMPVLRLVDSQEEERLLRLSKLRRELATIAYCNHEKDICTGECKITEEIREMEKKILGDP
jgi:hypothetical protein